MSKWSWPFQGLERLRVERDKHALTTRELKRTRGYLFDERSARANESREYEERIQELVERAEQAEERALKAEQSCAESDAERTKTMRTAIEVGHRLHGAVTKLWKAEAQRDTAWQELRRIRMLIEADEEESTADEVQALVSLVLCATGAPMLHHESGAYALLAATLTAGGSSTHSAGAAAIVAERNRQMNILWTSEHDDTHENSELALAAGAYLRAALYVLNTGEPAPEQPPTEWPWAEQWWRPGPATRMLEKAGALIAAEHDRINRKAAKE